MARKKRKSNFKSRRKSRGIGGFKAGKIGSYVADAAALGAGAVIGDLAISKIPSFGIIPEKFSPLKAVLAGVLIKTLVPRSAAAHSAAGVAIGVGIAQTVKGFGVLNGIYGDPLQGWETLNGPYDRAEGEPGSPLQGLEEESTF